MIADLSASIEFSNTVSCKLWGGTCDVILVCRKLGLRDIWEPSFGFLSAVGTLKF